MNREQNKYVGWRFLYSPRWIGYYAMLVIFAVACVLLSDWQFNRREEARAEIARIVNNYDAPAKNLSEVLRPGDSFDTDDMKWLPVTVTGEFVGEPLLARNRPGAGGSGSDVVRAFQATDGTVIFVDLGWVDYSLDGDTAADFAALPTPPTGKTHDLTIRLRASEPQIKDRVSTTETVGTLNVSDMLEVANRKGPAISEQQLITAAYGMFIAAQPTVEHGALPDKPALDEGPHLSYALQWIVFIAIAGSGVWYAARQEFKNFNRGSARVKQMEEKAQAKQRAREAKRGKSDADIEDELLDG
ncbi:SURF1 family protein [Canibacter zhoujuaniae]|uniref:SURF1 family cytochrome oxidase biogenesis protein n=1 Tax=Canibacter zhoujuaniae TaxID=2708343 RepID=UPI001FBC0973|nr:SURF1 family protein [Canibacter zhoujuaniae]